jgi:glycerol-3-phosphate O-acyltransferase
LKSTETRQGVETARKLDYGATSDLVGGFFAWKPGRLSSVMVKALSWVMHPLEQGSYGGRPLSGEPHRASWVIASPLAVFVLPEEGYRQKLFLAARLRNTGPINIIQDPPVGGRAGAAKGPAGAEKRKEGKRARPGRDRGARKVTAELASLLPASSRRDGEDVDFAFDLEALIAVQRESEVALTVVPVVRAFHQMTPDAPATTVATRVYKFNPMQVVRKTTSWARTFRTARVKNCRPVVLSRWLEANPRDDLCSQAAALRVELMGNIESERRALTGPPISPKWEVKRRVLADPALAAYMQEYALAEGITREAVLARARGYLDEIASDYRVGVVRYFCRVVDYFFDRFLDDIEVDREGIRFLSECDSRSRIVLVCAHKSYVDPLLIGYTLFRSGMVPPQQASGLNLNFWPVGWLLRHSGAFYLRRSFAGETLYRERFSAYIRYLLAENYTSVLYIEGTRSRDGKLQRPKTGYLRILAECLNAGVCPDITLVPVYLGYDKVPEEPAHVREMAGGRKVSESVKGFARIYKSFNTRLGRAYVKFGTPMSFKGLMREQGLEGTALIASDGINSITPVTARSLAACAILAPGTAWVSEQEFDRAVSDLLQFCARRSLPLAVNSDPEGVKAAVDWFALEGHVVPESSDGVAGFRIAVNGRRFLEYNKNIPLGHFLEPALFSIASRAAAHEGSGNSITRRTRTCSARCSPPTSSPTRSPATPWARSTPRAPSRGTGSSRCVSARASAC